VINLNLFYSCQKSDAGYQRHFSSTQLSSVYLLRERYLLKENHGSVLSDRIYAKSTRVLVTDSVNIYNTNMQSNTGHDRLCHWMVTDSKYAWVNFGYQNFPMDNSVLKRTCSVESIRIACNTIQLNTLADFRCMIIPAL
jgi:hypothetical protein